MNSVTQMIVNILLIGGALLLLFGFVFLIWYGIVWVFCWAFSITFSVKYVIGVWLVAVIVGLMLKKETK